jgi:hypothetical protein
MKKGLRSVAILAIEEIDSKLRVTEEKDAATSEATEAELDLRIDLLIRERQLWATVLDPGNVA